MMSNGMEMPHLVVQSTSPLCPVAAAMVHLHVEEEEESMSRGNMTVVPYPLVKMAIHNMVEVVTAAMEEVATVRDLLAQVVMALLVVGLEAAFLLVVIVEVEATPHRAPKHTQIMVQASRVEGTLVGMVEGRTHTLMEVVLVVVAVVGVVALIQPVVEWEAVGLPLVGLQLIGILVVVVVVGMAAGRGVLGAETWVAVVVEVGAVDMGCPYHSPVEGEDMIRVAIQVEVIEEVRHPACMDPKVEEGVLMVLVSEEEAEGEEDILHRLSLVVETIPLHRHPNLDMVLLRRHRIVVFLLALALGQSAMGRGTVSLDLTTSDIFNY